jgi:hypothetical protein
VYAAGEVSLTAAQNPAPQNAASTNGMFTFSVPTTAGLTVVVEYTDALISPQWKLLTTFAGDGTLKPVVDPNAPVPGRYYRVGLR